MSRSLGSQLFNTVVEVVWKLARHYTGKLVILLVSRGRWECGSLEANLSETGLRHRRGRKVYVTTAGVNLVGSLALVLLGGVGFLIWYLRAPDRLQAHVYAWVAVVVLSLALLRILWKARRISKEDTQARANATIYILEINESSVPSPTESDLRKALASLRADEEPYNLTLHQGSSWMQVTCLANDSFVIQTQEGAEKRQHEAVEHLSTDATAKLLLACAKGDLGWKRYADWK